jgi:biotin carboxylase
MGLKVVAVDENPFAPGLKVADVGIVSDIKNVDDMVKLGEKYKIDGVIAHAVEIPQVVARIAQKLELPGLDPEIAENATNKIKRISCFNEYGVPSAKFKTASNVKEAESQAKNLGFPCVFKPVDNSGARGVIKVENLNEVSAAFNHTMKYSHEDQILIEEFLEGHELSIEAIIYEEKLHPITIGDRFYNKTKFKPFFIQEGGRIPSKLQSHVIKKVLKTFNLAIKSLKVNWGVVRGDIIITPIGQIKIIEVAVRTSGSRHASIRGPLSCGINTIKLLILLSLGFQIIPEDLKPKNNRCVIDCYLFPEPGIITELKGVDDASRLNGVYGIYLDEHIKLGGEVNKVTDHTKRVGQIIVVANNCKEAKKIMNQAKSMIKISTEP